MNITLTGTASPAGWQHSIHQYVELPPSHVIKFSISGNSWGVCVKSNGTTHWLVGLDASGNPTVEEYNGSSYTQVASRVTTYSGAMDVLVQFSEIRFGSATDLWHTVAMWINGVHVINYVEAQATPLSDDVLFGLAVRASGTKTFTNILVPQLGEQAEVATIDTDETPSSGLQRTIDGRYLKYQVRYNGQLHAWRSEPMDAVAQFDGWDSMSEDKHEDKIRTHVRMVGAYDFAEYTNDSLIPQFGYSFQEQNNPYLMSEHDDYREARNTVRRLLESAVSGNLNSDAIHFLEVEDGIIVNGNPRLTNTFTLSYRGPQVDHQFDYRADVWDDF